MSRAQIQAQVFVYILALIVMSMVLIYGYGAINDLTKLGQQACLIKLRSDMSSTIEQAAYDYGSVQFKRIDVCSGIRKICFVDLTAPGSMAGYPYIKDSVDSGAYKNLFLIPGVESDYVGNISVANGFACFNATGGRVEIRLEGLGNKANIS